MGSSQAVETGRFEVITKIARRVQDFNVGYSTFTYFTKPAFLY